MDTWDAESADVGLIPVVPVVKNKWQDEDIEEDVADSWDQEPEEQVEKEKPTQVTSQPKKNLKKIGEKFEEKEKKKRQQLAAGGLENSVEKTELTPEEILAEKLIRQKLQEESDLSIAKEVFGVVGSHTLESKEDYDKLKDEVLKLVTDSVKNNNYFNFCDEVIQALCVHLNSADIKKIHTWVGNLHIEKNKMEKGDKSKKSKGKGKAKLKMEGDNDFSEYSAYVEDYDDFI